MTSILSRGLAAGAVGTTVIEAVTWLDMALTGRAPSTAQDDTTVGVLTRLGVPTPQDAHRRSAYGALGGIAAGLGIGVASSVARSLGLKVSAPVGAVLTGATAMVATDVPMVLTGVSDPRTWTRADWVRDVVPHLAYGVGVRWTLDRMAAHDDEAEAGREAHPVTPGLLARSAALGLASGSRSSLGVGGPLAGDGTVARLVSTALVGTELVMDKLPATPSRLLGGGIGVRAATGAFGAGWLARRQSADPVLPAVAGLAGALVGTFAGAAWRDVSAQRGWTWQAAVAEDVTALGLSWLAVRGT